MQEGQGKKIEEVKIAEGIYFTDFRQNQSKPQQLSSAKYIPPTQMLLLSEDFNEFNNKIKQLKYSIEEIKKEDNWQEDQIYKEAIGENYLSLLMTTNKQIQILEEIYKLDPQSKIFNEFSISQFQEDIEKYKQEYKEFQNLIAEPKNGVYL